LRDIYFAKWKGYYIISTDLKWVAKATNYYVLNLKNLGSVWLLNNQLTHKSVLNNIERLGPGGYITFENNVHTIRRKLYQPKEADDSRDFKETLEHYTSLFPGPSHMLSLGLSGGLDSRSLFSILLKNKQKNWSVHTFGSIDHPDSRIARRIASHYQVTHTLIDATLPAVNDSVAFLKQTIGRNPVSIPASEIMNLRNYLPLKNNGYVVIDGGAGEMSRRQYLNRLLFKGEKALRDQAVDSLYPHLTHRKAHIFNKETLAVLVSGVRDDLLDIFQTMPDVNAMAVGNWLDLLAVRTRLPNFFGFAQGNADNHIISVMPFAQPELLDAIFQMPVQERKNGKLLKHIIKETSRDLVKFDLVKFNTTYPFCFSSLASYLYCKAKIRFGRAYRSTKTSAFLFNLKEFVQDTMHSESVKNYPLYDYPYIKHMVNAFYHGNHRYQHDLDWWLAFELFR
jgi:hypothetical protein